MRMSHNAFDYDTFDRKRAEQNAEWAKQGRTRCDRCAGTGIWKGGLYSGPCFKCKGEGSVTKGAR